MIRILNSCLTTAEGTRSRIEEAWTPAKILQAYRLDQSTADITNFEKHWVSGVAGDYFIVTMGFVQWSSWGDFKAGSKMTVKYLLVFQYILDKGSTALVPVQVIGLTEKMKEKDHGKKIMDLVDSIRF